MRECSRAVQAARRSSRSRRAAGDDRGRDRTVVSDPTYYMRTGSWSSSVARSAISASATAATTRTRRAAMLCSDLASNKAAAASHNPCMPAPNRSSQPYFNVAPDRTRIRSSSRSALPKRSSSPASPARRWRRTGCQRAGVHELPDGRRERPQLRVRSPEGAQRIENRSTVTLNSAPQGGYAISFDHVEERQHHPRLADGSPLQLSLPARRG